MDGSEQSVSRDRGLRLVLFGSLTALFGLGLVGLAALYLLLAVAALADLAPAGVDAASAVGGAALWLVLGVTLVITGAGSILAHRWAPPLITVIGWLWLLGGVLALPLVPPMADAALAQGAAPAATARLVAVGLLGGVALFGVALPALLIRVYRDPDVARTCARRHPAPSRVERVPRPVLGLAVALGAAAVLTLPLALRPVVPLFGLLVGGLPAALIMLAGAVACAWLAAASLQQRPVAWWGVMLLVVLTGASTAVTLHRVPFAELYGAMGHDEALVAAIPDLGAVPAWVTWALTVASVGWMLGVRRHFGLGAEAVARAGADSRPDPQT